MRLLRLFSKPRNDEFYGILEFLRLEFLKLEFLRKIPQSSCGGGDDIVGNSRIPIKFPRLILYTCLEAQLDFP